MRIFVYGTLKRGFFNNDLLRDSTFLGEANLLGYRLYTFKNGGPPVIVEEGHEYFVTGELWEVDDKTLASLDRLEGHPNLYRRATVATNTMAYVWPHGKENIVPFPTTNWEPPRSAYADYQD